MAITEEKRNKKARQLREHRKRLTLRSPEELLADCPDFGCCSVCKFIKPKEEFSRNLGIRQTFNCKCKVCQRAYDKDPRRREAHKLRCRKEATKSPRYLLDARLRNGIRKSFRLGHSAKPTYTKLVYAKEELCSHLQSTLPAGHTWEDYVSGKLQVDHIRPRSSFSYENEHQLGFKMCWALSNLQLLTAEDNMYKASRTE